MLRSTKRFIIAVRFSTLLLMILLSTGCRCPWTCTNNSLADSSRWSQSGIEAFHEGNHDHAEKLLVQAIQSRPGDPILREHLASIYEDQNKTSEAISQLMQAAELSGPHSELFVKIGKLYLANGQWILANQYVKQALQADRRNPDAWVLQADIKLAQGELSPALSDYQRALSLKPALPQVQMQVAQVQRLLGRPMRAYSTIEQLHGNLPIEQQSTEVLVFAGSLLVELRQPAQAIERFQIAATRSDASADCFVQLANAHLAMGNSVQAKEILDRARGRYPQEDSIATQLERLLGDQQRIAAVETSTTEITR